MCIVYMRIVYMCIAIDAKNRVLKYDIVGSGGGAQIVEHLYLKYKNKEKEAIVLQQFFQKWAILVIFVTSLQFAVNKWSIYKLLMPGLEHQPSGVV